MPSQISASDYTEIIPWTLNNIKQGHISVEDHREALQRIILIYLGDKL